MAVHAAEVKDARIVVKEVDVVFGQDWLLAVRQPVEDETPMDFHEVQRRFERVRLECRDDDLGCALWAVLDVIVDGYFSITELVDERLDDIEEIVFGDERHDAIPQEVFTLRRGLVRFRRAAAPLREVIGMLLRREVDWIGAESIVLLQDVYDHSLRVADLIESQRDLLTGLLEAHLAVMSNRMNDVMKKTRRLGRDPAGLHAHRRHLRHELPAHARAPLALRLPVALGFMAIATVVLWCRFKKQGLAVAPRGGAAIRRRHRAAHDLERDAARRRRSPGRSRRCPPRAGSARRSRGSAGSPAHRGTRRPSRAAAPAGSSVNGRASRLQHPEPERP